MLHISSKDRLYKFQELFLNATEICLAVSYIRDSGVKIIRPLYHSTSNQAIIKILLDTRMNISEKNALMTLLEDGINLKSYHGIESYHPKVFLFRIDNIWQAIIGSMNLTKGGLTQNIEYGLFLNDPSVQEAKTWFDQLWDNNNSKLIDRSFINQMPMYEKSTMPKEKIIAILSNEIRDISSEEIKNFISEWTKDQNKKGRSMRKNGWRFRPSQGAFDEGKLKEFKEILQKCPITLTEEYCSDIFNRYNSFQARSSHKTSSKGMFIRTYKNYMEKLKIINYRGNTMTLTTLGERYIVTESENLKHFLVKALTEYTWFGVPIKDYFFAILEYVDNKLYKDEILLFVRHAGIKDYTYHTPYEIAKLVLSYRNLNSEEKNQIKQFAKQQFDENDISKSKTSWMNMAGNALKDLMYDLSLFEEINNEDEVLRLEM